MGTMFEKICDPADGWVLPCLISELVLKEIVSCRSWQRLCLVNGKTSQVEHVERWSSVKWRNNTRSFRGVRQNNTRSFWRTGVGRKGLGFNLCVAPPHDRIVPNLRVMEITEVFWSRLEKTEETGGLWRWMHFVDIRTDPIIHDSFV